MSLSDIIRTLKEKYNLTFQGYDEFDVRKVAEAILDKEAVEFYPAVREEIVQRLKNDRETIARTETAMSSFFGSSQAMDEQRSYWEKRRAMLTKDLDPKIADYEGLLERLKRQMNPA